MLRASQCVLTVAVWLGCGLAARADGPTSGKAVAKGEDVRKAVNWTWNPRSGSTDGADPANWANDAKLVGQVPSTANDNLRFDADVANRDCDLRMLQNVLGKMTVASNFTSKIVLGRFGRAFYGASILGACTLDLGGMSCNFGGLAAEDPSVIGVVGGARVTIQGGSIEVTNTCHLDLANVNLASSVNVCAGGTLGFGFVCFGTDTTSRFRINGGRVVSSRNAQFISSVSAVDGRLVYNQPIDLENGGRIAFVTDATVLSYIRCRRHSVVTVRGTPASPSVTLTVTGGLALATPLRRVIGPGGVLDLAPGSAVAGNVLAVGGGINLCEAPRGGKVTGTTIAGDLSLLGLGAPGVLNLNNHALHVTREATFSNAHITTNAAYGDRNPTKIGTLTVGGTATFIGTSNSLTQGATGTRKAFSLPLITATTVTREFDNYLLTPGVVKTKTDTAVTLSYDPNASGGLEQDAGAEGGRSRGLKPLSLRLGAVSDRISP